MDWNRQALNHERVQHIPTSAIGTVIKGGWRPRIRWEPTDRISRIDVRELRSLGMDERAVELDAYLDTL